MRLQKRRDACKRRRNAETGEERERRRLLRRSLDKNNETPEGRDDRLQSIRSAKQHMLQRKLWNVEVKCIKIMQHDHCNSAQSCSPLSMFYILLVHDTQWLSMW